MEIDPGSLPADAQFKGYADVVVQDIRLGTDNVLFHKAKYYSAKIARATRPNSARLQWTVWAGDSGVVLDVVLWAASQ